MAHPEQRREVAHAAIEYLQQHSLLENTIIGVGTGRTANYFIAALAEHKDIIKGTVASSKQTEEALQEYGLPVIPLQDIESLPIYVDSADEANQYGHLIKGGGGALTCEKILANFAQQFLCIIDEGKLVKKLGEYPLPVEVLPLARSNVAQQLKKLCPACDPTYRENFTTDNGNIIIDVKNLDLSDPVAMEQQINNIAGVITTGIFALRPADVLLMATSDGTIEVTNQWRDAGNNKK